MRLKSAFQRHLFCLKMSNLIIEFILLLHLILVVLELCVHGCVVSLQLLISGLDYVNLSSGIVSVISELLLK